MPNDPYYRTENNQDCRLLGTCLLVCALPNPSAAQRSGLELAHNTLQGRLVALLAQGTDDHVLRAWRGVCVCGVCVCARACVYAFVCVLV